MTGGSGFIGRRLLRVLEERGDTVTTLGGEPVGSHPHIAGDLTVGLATEPPPADYLVHLAARSGGIQTQNDPALVDDNASMTREVLAAAQHAGVSGLFLASSAVVYRDGSGDGITEESALVGPVDPNSTPYAWSKLLTEAMGSWFTNETGVPVVVGRFTTVYGRGGVLDPARSSVVHGLIARGLQQPPGGSLSVWGTGAPVRSFIHVDDVAAAIAFLSAVEDPPAVVNVSSGGPVSIAAIAEMVARAIGNDLRIDFDPSKPVGASDRFVRSERLESLGFEPRWRLDDGISDTVEWARSTSAGGNGE